MTPLVKIENGILGGDWNLVCEGFNKLTGKKMVPPQPVIMKLESKFDPDKATKKQLYEWLKPVMDMDDYSSYTTKELREIVSVHIMAAESEPVEIPIKRDNGYIHPDLKGGPFDNKTVNLPDGSSFLDGFRYTSGKKKLLPIDTQKVIATLDPQLKDVGDPTNEYTPREPPKKVKLKCIKCSKKFESYSQLGVEVDGELKALCPICSESI